MTTLRDSDRYPIVLFWSDEDEAWIADVPDLKYCSAHGETPEEALREILIAKELWLEVAQERGMSLPAPSRPAGEALTAIAH